MRKLLTEINFNEYVDRMSTPLDKDIITNLVTKGNTVLDYGSGSGVLAKNFSKNSYIGYDLSPEMIKFSKKINPGYFFTNELPKNGFNTIIYSSILHEIYSYNDFSIKAVEETLKEAYEILPKGGEIIIRDGVLPNDRNTNYTIKLVDSEEAQEFLRNLNEGPQFFNVRIEKDHLIGSLENIIHFLNIYTWGWDSLERERNERVNFLDWYGWIGLVESVGFKFSVGNMIVQKEYFKFLERIVDLKGMEWSTKVFFKFIKK